VVTFLSLGFKPDLLRSHGALESSSSITEEYRSHFPRATWHFSSVKSGQRSLLFRRNFLNASSPLLPCLT
jgi:hypothetical protein